MMKRKKIFFIMSTNDKSGAEIVNFDIIDNLQEKYEFYWVSQKGKINQYLEEKKIKWIEVSHLSIKEIKRIINEHSPDILHSTDFRASFYTALANNKKITQISHLHNNPEWLKKINPNSLALLYTAYKSKYVLTVSEAIEEEFILKKYIKNKFICVDNPISTNKINSYITPKNKIEKKYDICCVARLTEQKDPIRFLKIINEIKKQIPSIKTVWVGKGEMEVEVKNKINELGLKDNVELVGFKENPYEYINESRIFLLTSKWEGFGLVAFEALTLGLPCIVSNVGGLPKIVNNYCGRLCIHDYEFVEKICELITQESMLQEYSKRAYVRARELDNLNIYMNKVEKIYESV